MVNVIVIDDSGRMGNCFFDVIVNDFEVLEFICKNVISVDLDNDG